MELNTRGQCSTKLSELGKRSKAIHDYFKITKGLLNDLGSDPEDHEVVEEMQATMRYTHRGFAAVKADTLIVKARIAEL